MSNSKTKTKKMPIKVLACAISLGSILCISANTSYASEENVVSELEEKNEVVDSQNPNITNNDLDVLDDEKEVYEEKTNNVDENIDKNNKQEDKDLEVETDRNINTVKEDADNVNNKIEKKVNNNLEKENTEINNNKVDLKKVKKENNNEVNENSVVDVKKADGYYNINHKNNSTSRLYLYGDDIVRYYKDPKNVYKEDPDPTYKNKPALLIDNKEYKDKSNKKIFDMSKLTFRDGIYYISTESLEINIEKRSGLLSIFDKRSKKEAFKEVESPKFDENSSSLILSQDKNEYFYGGGTQNGRFSHKGEKISIVNSNNWVDGGVASPVPFYWSTKGYGILRNTFSPGEYDFTKKAIQKHNEDKIDSYIMINSDYYKLINDYHKITGLPALTPKYGFYPAHLNAYNRDYWIKVDAKTPGAVLFEDGNYYKEYQPGSLPQGKDATQESLNGEKDNYQFSARAVIDRYKKYDMPIGWFLPNDGYGAGYGQTDTLEGDIKNLKEFTKYAKKHGIEVGLWTQEELHPKDKNNPKKGDRDLISEVKDAGISALKTDVAWVGYGYSFGLNGTDDAADIMKKYGNIRPFIISLDGWAGTQRNAGIWSGDQTGGKWEYIRFHIPTYITTSISGNPNIGSDLDGIFGGQNKEINIRDFQWKTFTPIELNMDGWSPLPKNPFQYGEEANAINRSYLKLKSQMLPYIYSIAHDATFEGKPMIRAMFMDNKNDKEAFDNNSKYQYMWGDYLLVAPIYEPSVDENNERVRNNIYLPSGNIYYDLFTGKSYKGGQTLNNFKTPLWKLPVFVKEGAIIPLVNPNNNPTEIDNTNRIINYYPSTDLSEFIIKDDDGKTNKYLEDEIAKTKVSAKIDKNNKLVFNIEKTKGNYEGFVNNKSTNINILTSNKAKKIIAYIGGKEITLKEVNSIEEFNKSDNAYFYNDKYHYNSYMDKYAKDQLDQKFLMIKLEKTDVSLNDIKIEIEDFKKVEDPKESTIDKNLNVLTKDNISSSKITDKEFTVNIDSEYENHDILFNGTLYRNIGKTFTFKELDADTKYNINVRGVKDNKHSDFSDEIEIKTLENILARAIDVKKIDMNYPSQPGEDLSKLTDKDLSSMAHSDWGEAGQAKEGKPFEIIAEFDKEYELEKMVYYPRDNGGNGNWTNISIYVSKDGEKFELEKENLSLLNDSHYPDNKAKTINLNGIKAKYVKVVVNSSVGNFSSGNELLFIPKEEKKLDINKPFFENYAGLEEIDSDFGGYVERADLNKDGIIDSFDIYNQLSKEKIEDQNPTGNIEIVYVGKDENHNYIYKIKAKDFSEIGGFSLKLQSKDNSIKDNEISISYNEKLQNSDALNFSKWRKHSNGEENYYIIWTQTEFEGDNELAIIRSKKELEVDKVKLITNAGNQIDIDGIIKEEKEDSETPEKPEEGEKPNPSQKPENPEEDEKPGSSEETEDSKESKDSENSDGKEKPKVNNNTENTKRKEENEANPKNRLKKSVNKNSSKNVNTGVSSTNSILAVLGLAVGLFKSKKRK